jgi:hypothetical protein
MSPAAIRARARTRSRDQQRLLLRVIDIYAEDVEPARNVPSRAAAAAPRGVRWLEEVLDEDRDNVDDDVRHVCDLDGAGNHRDGERRPRLVRRCLGHGHDDI